MKYTMNTKESVVKAQIVNAPISLKVSVVMSSFLKGKSTEKAKSYLEDVINEKKAIPFSRFNKDRGHKRGIGPGRYPKKASKYFISLIKAAEANASLKGLNSNLIITNIISNKGNVGYHYGRRRGLKTKATHLQIYVEESVVKKQQKKESVKKDDSKNETKKEVSKPKPSNGKEKVESLGEEKKSDNKLNTNMKEKIVEDKKEWLKENLCLRN